MQRYVEQAPYAVPYGAPEPEQRFDIGRTIAGLRRRIKIVGIVTAVVFLAVLAYALQATPKYVATAEVQIQRQAAKVLNQIDEVDQAGAPDTTAVDTEAELLKSHQLASHVVEDLSLDKDPEFNPALGSGGPIGVVMHALTGWAKDSDNAKGGSPAIAEDAVASTLEKNLTVKRAGLSYVIDVSFKSNSPVKSAKIANAFVTRYIADKLGLRTGATEQVSQSLRDKMDGLRKQAEAADAAVQSYKAANGLLAAAGDTTIASQEISSVQGQLATAQGQQADADAQLAAAKQATASGGSGETSSAVLSSPVVQQLRAQRADVSRHLAELQDRYGPKHPELVKAQNQLRDIDTQIKDEVGRQMSNLSSQAAVARQRVNALQGQLNHARGSLTSNNQASVKLLDLQREADTAQSVYKAFLDRYQQTSAQQGLAQSDANMTSPATPPKHPSFPNVPLLAAAGLIAGLVLGFAIAFLLDMMESGIATADEAERVFNVPALGSIPLLSSIPDVEVGKGASPATTVVEKPLSSFAEAFRILKMSILCSRPGETVKVVAVTSALPGEGKTTACLCLARTSALSGARTLLIDCDLRRQTAGHAFSREPTAGLLDVLGGTATIDEALLRDSKSGFYILPASRGAFAPGDMLGGPGMDALLAELRRRFDFIILDSAPVLPVVDSRFLGAKADTTIFLCRWRRTPRRATLAALKILKSVGAHIGGVALSQVDLREQAKTGFGDPEFYYNSYRHYYAGEPSARSA